MGPNPPPTRERRRDARLTPAGTVRIQQPAPARPTVGRLVDVSARGVRLAWPAEGPAAEGRVTVEIKLDDPLDQEGPPRLVLDGQGRVVWVEDLGDDGIHAGIEFDAPMDVRQSFPEVSVF